MVVEMRNREIGVKYVKDGGWITVVRRRKKSARSESRGNLNDKKKLGNYRKVDGITGFISGKT